MSANLPNRALYCGDNIDILRRINDECVDLIATDPPYNSGRNYETDRAKFEDKWEWLPQYDEHMEEMAGTAGLKEAIEAAKHTHSEAMGAFMCWLSVRLLEMRRLLKPTGSIYVQCDPTASHYLKTCMDAIFGPKNFRNEIVWCYEKPRPAKRVPDAQGKMELRKPFKRPDGSTWHPKEPGKQAGSWWIDIPSFATRVTAKERTGYPTQKPVELYKRIIEASSRKGNIVMDPFCGSGTTLVAAEALNRKWVGMDRHERLEENVGGRFRKELFIHDIRLSDLPERTDEETN